MIEEICLEDESLNMDQKEQQQQKCSVFRKYLEVTLEIIREGHGHLAKEGSMGNWNDR